MTRPDHRNTPPRDVNSSWMERAACRDERDFTDWPLSEQRAMCVGCPVRNECVVLGIETARFYYIRNSSHLYGGFTHEQLRKIGKRLSARTPS